MKKYEVILADPPWAYNDLCHAGQRGVTYKYGTMSNEEICALPVSDFAAENCALFLWVTNPQLPVGLKVMKRWGFEFVTVAFVWVKKTKHGKLFWGMGSSTRSGTEIVLYVRRGKPKRISAGVHQVIEAQVREHSRKPDEVRKRIVELMGDVPRLEMFARPPKEDGWDVWGDQIDSDVKMVPRGIDLSVLSRLALKGKDEK